MLFKVGVAFIKLYISEKRNYHKVKLSLNSGNNYVKRIKIDGTWEIDGAGDIYIKDGHIMKLLDENYKGVPTKIKFGIGSFNANSAIGGFSNTGTERGGNKTWMKNSSGCITLDSFCGEIMGGSINDKFSVESIVNVM